MKTKMTYAMPKEFADAIRGRYAAAANKDKRRILEVNRAGFPGGSNFQVEWSHDEQDNEQIQP